MVRRLAGVLSCLIVLSVSLHAKEGNADRVIRTSQGGPWSAPATWEGGKVPAGGSTVLVREGHTVVYDVKSGDIIRSIHVSGTLTFAHDRDTRLDVGLIRIAPGNKIIEEGFDCDHAPDAKKREVLAANAQQPGFSAICVCCDNKAALLVGTPEQPIGPKHTALIRLHPIAGMDRQSCPAIVCCGGRMDFHGAPMNHTWFRLGATAQSGEDEIVLAGRPDGWKVGDRVIVTGSSGNFGGQPPQTEERRIKAIRDSRLTLDGPLAYSHSGEGEFRAEVGNLSRNVVVESAEPDGDRGHTMYHAHSAGSISYAEFRHLGKTGILGRYPLHFHLCRDTMRGSSVVGASIWDSHNRWIAVHGTEYLIVRDCVGYRCTGHGFFLEDGTEVYNVFDQNLAVRAENGEPLPQQALPFDKNDGAGFWWANSHNTFTRNVAADCAGYGFRYEATPRAGFNDKDSGRTFGEPNRPFRLTLPVRRPDGGLARLDIRTLPFVRFESNTAHNIANYALNLGQDAGGVGPDRNHPFVIRDMKIWNAQRGYTVHVPHVLIDGMHIHRCGYEVYRARYQGQDYRNVRLSGIRGKYAVSDLESYLASGQAVGEPGVGLNRSRLPGFPRGTGAGGTSYQGSEFETADLNPVDDLPPITVITHVRKEGDRLIIRGTTSDNGELKRVLVNGKEADLVDKSGNWQVSLSGNTDGAVPLAAHAEDAAGNVERGAHKMTVVVR